jgi:hypothetical protein
MAQSLQGEFNVSAPPRVVRQSGYSRDRGVAPLHLYPDCEPQKYSTYIVIFRLNAKLSELLRHSGSFQRSHR